MRLWNVFKCYVLFTIVLAASAAAQSTRAAAVLYDNARLILGNGNPPIENGSFVVENGRITAIGRKGSVKTAKGAIRVDLAGKTVMPALINVHVHIGYEGYTSWGAEN